MKKLLWIDMEMTGLDVEKERIIEVAALVTDINFQTLETYESVVYQAPELLSQMDDWNRTHHGKSGLLAKIPMGKKEQTVEQELVSLVKRHFIKTEETNKPSAEAGSTYRDAAAGAEKPLQKSAEQLESEKQKKLSEKAILCGNSIGQDRAFINRYMPEVASLLHYRMLDVSSWKIIFQSKFDKAYKKNDSHRALDDIQESINELKFYLQFVKV